MKSQALQISNRSHNYFRLPCSAAASTPPIHFVGANGFPVGTYFGFLNELAKHYDVSAADSRACDPIHSIPNDEHDFSAFADDLIEVIEKLHRQRVIVVGHSFGAHIAVIAANKRPDLFAQIVLIEPASLPNALLGLIYQRLPIWLLHSLVPLIPQTLNRNDQWASKNEFIEDLQAHRVFRHLPESTLEDFALHGLRFTSEEHEKAHSLVFPLAWEAHIYSKVEYIWTALAKLKTQTLFLKAEHSYLYSKEQFIQRNKALPDSISTQELPNTYHLFPLEKPRQCATAVLEWLALHSHTN